MIKQRFRAQVSTQDGKLLHIAHGGSAPEAFERAWALMKKRLSEPLPPDMQIAILHDRFGDERFGDENDHMRQAYTVLRTVRVVKRSKQDCEDCGFPDVAVEEGIVQAADTMGFLQMGDLMAMLVSDEPTVISSPPFKRQLECDCCKMLIDKGVRPPPREVRL